MKNKTTKDELYVCIDVLCQKKWGRTLVNGQLKSKLWWEKRRKAIIESQAIKIPVELLWDGNPAELAPIPYEEEMKLDKPKEK